MRKIAVQASTFEPITSIVYYGNYTNDEVKFKTQKDKNVSERDIRFVTQEELDFVLNTSKVESNNVS